MSTKTKASVLVASFAVLLFMVVGELGGVRASSPKDGPYHQLEVYSEVLSRIHLEYVEDPNLPAVTDGALHGLLESLDPNSSFLTAAEYKEYKARNPKATANIDAGVSKRYGYATVISVIPGGAADKAGVDGGDIFEAIDGKSTHDLSLAEIRNLLTGEPGSNVTVSVVRARRANAMKIVITRDQETVPAVADKILDDGVGYLKVDALSQGKSLEIANKIKALQKQGAKKLVLDLRNSSEGDEAEGIATANLFLDHGTITYLQGQKYPRQSFNADPAKAVTNLPLVVLVNRGTAGPAEIVAAAVMGNARGDVVGDKTFGDGSVQKTMELSDGSALILSIAKYYAPDGKSIQDNAVTPSVTVADNEDDVASPDDEQEAAPPADEVKKVRPQQDDQLDRALQVLKNRANKS